MSAATMNMVEQLRAQNADLSEQLKQAEWAIAEGGASLKSALEREQALAAHVERMVELLDGTIESNLDTAPEYDREVSQWLSDKPSHSLTKRDLIKQAEVLEDLGNKWEWERPIGHKDLRHAASELRQQAAALDGKGE